MESSLKIVLLGDSAVGKSSITIRFVEDLFDTYQPSTVGAAFLTKKIKIGDKDVLLEIWDTAGQERYRSLAPMYYRNAAAAIVMFDLTNPNSLAAASTWLEELSQKGEEGLSIALVGNKSDLKDQIKVTNAEALEFHEKSNTSFYMETSAKSGVNVKELFERLTAEALENNIKSDTNDTSVIELISGLESDNKRKCC